MNATAEEIVTACLEGMRTGRQKDKRFIVERSDDDIYLRIRQGETSRIADQISEELRGTMLDPNHNLWRERIYGTKAEHVPFIMRDGLEAGRRAREDVHFAGSEISAYDDTGVRNETDRLIVVDAVGSSQAEFFDTPEEKS